MSQTIPAPNFTLIHPEYIRLIYLLGLAVICSLILVVILAYADDVNILGGSIQGVPGGMDKT